MQRVATVVLAIALLAPSFPFPLIAEEIATTTPTEEAPTLPVASSTPPFEESVATSTEETASTTEEVGEDESPQTLFREAASVSEAYEGPVLYAQFAEGVPRNTGGTIAVGIHSAVNYEYQGGVRYVPTTTESISAAAFALDRPHAGVSGYIRAEVWTEEGRIAISEPRDVSEFLLWEEMANEENGIRDSLEVFEFAAPVLLEEGKVYFIVAGANEDFVGYLDMWVWGTPNGFVAVRQNSTSFAFSGVGPYHANIILYGEAAEPVCVEDCYSSVLFLPGLKGSVLRTNTEVLWPADSSGSDFPQLALNEDGTSVNEVFVDGILPDFKIEVPLLGEVGPEIYSGFITYMNGLVTSGTIQEWEPLPYDWRYSPEYIVSHDIETPTGPVNLVAEVERMASREHSRTGKVTLVAHSMGGLVGKALIKALEEKGEADLIDSFVMVGSPELGTPQAVASLLHGDQEGIPGKSIIPNFVATRYVVRSVGRDLPGAYSLLPSEEYFEKVEDPVISFSSAPFTQDWRNYFGVAGIDSYESLKQFVTGTGVARVRPNPSTISVPEVLRTDLVETADSLHKDIDTYVIPSNIRVVQIAGWGEETTKAVAYTAPHFLPSYDTVPTIEGDGVVVYPSAVASGGEKYYFNLFSYKEQSDIAIDHGTLLNSNPIHIALGNLVTGGDVSNIDFISSSKPEADSVSERLRVSTFSPVILGAYDPQGNFTGINPNQDLTAAYLYVQENIPGSSFTASGDTQSLYLPKHGSYRFVYKGTGSGPTTLKVESFSNDTLVPISTYNDIPTSNTTSAVVVIDSSTPENARIEIDQNGDGNPDLYVASEGNPLSIVEIVTNLRTAVLDLAVKDKLRIQLLNKIGNIESKITKQKQKQSNVLSKLQVQITKKAGKGKIDTATANSISVLLDELIAQSTLVPLETSLVQQLKDQINAANITTQLKTNLLNKVARVENLSGISKSLDTMIKLVVKKGAKGAIPDTDIQILLNLLDQLQGTV
jgi:hypothetical protein